MRIVEKKKVYSLKTLSKVLEIHRKKGQRIGLVTGCFDILHVGHARLFQAAKKKVNLLVVGLDSDGSIRLSKGENRPFFNFSDRAEVISKLTDIDYVFKIEGKYLFYSPQAESAHEKVYSKLQPNALLTNPSADKFWKEKKSKCEKYKILFIPLKGKKLSSTSQIAKKLQTIS